MRDTSTKTKKRRPDRGAGASQDSGPPRHAPATSWLEWAAAAVGLVLVIGLIGYVVYYAVTTEATVPAVTIDVAGVDTVPGAYVARFRAHNRSSVTAAALTIRGELRQGSTVVEASEATLDHLPPFSERRGGLYFQLDPRSYELRIVPKSYAEP